MHSYLCQRNGTYKQVDYMLRMQSWLNRQLLPFQITFEFLTVFLTNPMPAYEFLIFEIELIDY